MRGRRFQHRLAAEIYVRLIVPAARAAAALVIGVASTGCVQVSLPPDARLVPRPLPTTFDDKDWAAVLRGYARNGLVDYDGLARNRDALDRYCALISAMGPATAADQFPTRYHRMAYDINAFNALMLYAVIADPSRASLYDLSMPPPETGLTFLLDGKPTTLRAIEERLLVTSDNDARVIFALSRAAIGGPALRSEPYRAEFIERQLQEAAAAALDNPHLLQIDNEQQAIFVWLNILERRDAFLAFWQNRRRSRTPQLLSVLTDLASARRRPALASAIGYTIRPMPFDRRLNRWTPPSGTGTPPGR